MGVLIRTNTGDFGFISVKEVRLRRSGASARRSQVMLDLLIHDAFIVTRDEVTRYLRDNHHVGSHISSRVVKERGHPFSLLVVSYARLDTGKGISYETDG